MDGYIRFGEGTDAIPEYARPVIVSVVAEVLSMARKQEYGTISAIATICDTTASESAVSAQVADLCHSRLRELAGLINDEAANEPESRRPPTLQVFSQRRMGSRQVVYE